MESCRSISGVFKGAISKEILRSIFGPSKRRIWSQVAKDIGGEYDREGFWGRGLLGFWVKGALKYKHGDWEIELDTHTASYGTGKTAL